jgi:hypothetical protein
MAVKKKKTNEISVSEFKSWISGIEDMQEDGWVPNKVQWDKIKSKINLLSESVDAEPSEINEPQKYYQPAPQMPWPQPPQFQQQPWLPQAPGSYGNPPSLDDDITYSDGSKPAFL